ncbi:MAG: ATP-dependent helicase, partial [Lysinibacillus sp.]
MGFDIKRVIDILQSSQSIERVLQNSYRKVEYPFTRVGVRARNLPLFNKELYELIIKLKRLPEVAEYEKHYIKKYLSRSTNRIAMQYHANIAYKALILDLHFYFVLKRSTLFDDVQMKYDHDVAAQTDLLLRKNGKELGIQVFSGNENYRLTKQRSIEKIKDQLGYELILYNVRDNLEWKKKLQTLDGSEMLLFSEFDAQHIAKHFTGAKTTIKESFYGDSFEVVPVRTHALPKKAVANVQYSYIFIGLITKEVHSYLNRLSKSGIKVFSYNLKQGNPAFTAIDGKYFKLNDEPIGTKEGLTYIIRYKKYLTGLNLHQYLVEHAYPKFNLAVNAGAGSGKTTTLVSRILFLLFTKEIESLQQLVMITFTNEAANNMKEALEERLEKLYRLTGDAQHYDYMQEINAMKIVTIPTFAKEILKQFSHHLGLSANIEVSQMTMAFREVLEKALDEELADHKENPFEKLAYYKITKFLESVWDKFSQKGIIESELTQYLEENSEDDELKVIVTRILSKVDKEFTDLKFDSDFLTVADLTRFLKLLIHRKVPLVELNKSYKYLFVDEFQDTDIAQIQFIATVAAQAGLHLTVVGDTKQSVYRFRGADSTAFTVLNEYLKSNKARHLTSLSLVENFRSSKELIEEMEKIFGKWRKREFLPSNERAMVSNQKNKIDQKEIFGRYDYKFSMSHMLQDFELMPKGGAKPNVLAILVRNNDEAIQIGEELKQLEGGPEYEVRTEGTLYMSKAARDLGVLLHSWLYANAGSVTTQQALFSLSDTAFCYKEDAVTFTMEGLLVGAKDLEIYVPDTWYEALELMKDKPVLAVIENFLSKSDYALNLEAQEMDEKLILKYELNLEKITLDIYMKFGQGATLVQIYDWLRLQIATNRESDEAELEDAVFNENFIRVMTVHKAKGLQFHTVIIPNPNNPFVMPTDAVKEDIIVQIGEKDALKFGWKYKDKQNQFTSITTKYQDLRNEENQEQRREEAR